MIPWSQIVEAVLLSFGTAAASITITKSKFFRSFRIWVLDIGWGYPNMSGDFPRDVVLGQMVKDGVKQPFIYQLITCPYCMSHWIAALGVLLFNTNVMGDPVVAGYIVTWLCIVAASSLVGGLVIRSYEE